MAEQNASEISEENKDENRQCIACAMVKDGCDCALKAVALSYEERNRDYRTLITNVAGCLDLRPKNIENIVSLEPLPALEVLRLLEERGVFGPDDIQPLAKLLKKIKRYDVINNYVGRYQATYERRRVSTWPKSCAGSQVTSELEIRAQSNPTTMTKKLCQQGTSKNAHKAAMPYPQILCENIDEEEILPSAPPCDLAVEQQPDQSTNVHQESERELDPSNSDDLSGSTFSICTGKQTPPCSLSPNTEVVSIMPQLVCPHPRHHRQEIQWLLQRMKLNQIIDQSKTKTYVCSPKVIKLDFGMKAKPKLIFKLYPCGLEEDCGNFVTFEIEIKIPKRCPRLPSSAKVNLFVTALEYNEGGQYLELSDTTVEKSMTLRQFTIFKFISHTFLRESHSDIKIIASANLTGVDNSKL